ncbi:Por secretion system C-terminal sorting domain-containing protein [Chitinophaga sp. CF118]|uniref:T9SS type A sorting domain-containing protein n=1 Tax=Chitinophaga sp. CF118 TaxID=1884367 RepID=UPI0008F2CA9B|nr:T9SS type A sorting domain-containing protein [Chitinophaga sp. CF118]SFF01977.1 Por secretion system C-terminal sorting domain-containing protein [Chitinophaga sp. CF118]
MKKRILFSTLLLLIVFYSKAQVIINETGGWLESAYVKWAPVSGAGSYNIYYTGGGVVNQKIDNQLVRSYGTYFRADVLGLAAGNYTLKVVPVIAGSENTTLATTTQSLTIKPHVREGFSFSGNIVPGAYNANGTPKSGRKIIYITASTVNTVTSTVITDSKGKTTVATGLMNILTALGKGYDKTPLIIRMIGLIRDSQITGLKDGNYISFTGFNNTTRKLENITFEGVGDDATAYGYGFYTKRCNSIEIRNVGIMLYGDDGVSLETDNSNIWIHNNDFFYGAPGSDADQVKGDGSIDMKYNSSNITISFNHFWDSGKSMGCGGPTETVPTLYITFHHNWFDHVDSRNPRLHYVTAHVYNNYYDGVSKYGIGNTTQSSAFVEANHFRNCKRPMMISGQGTDTYNSITGAYTAEGTFSDQDGGMTKAFNNKVENAERLVYQTQNATQFDAYLVNTRNEQVPGTVKSLRGEFSYTNFDISPTMYVSNPDLPGDVQSIVTTYAGRLKGGDFKWTFNNSVDDALSDVNTALKTAIVNYQTSLVAVQGEGTISVTGMSVIDNKFTPQSTISVYPNPASSYTNLKFTLNKESPVAVDIYDMAGLKVKSVANSNSQAGTNNIIVDVANLKSGMYVIKITINGSTISSRLIVK